MAYTILLIEDNRDLRESTAEILELEAFVVLCAENGSKGLTLAISEHPDLILCDITMPELDGYQVCDRLKANPNTAQIPFVFLTAKSEMKDRKKGMDLHCDGYVVKPFDDTQLLETVNDCLKRKIQKQ